MTTTRADFVPVILRRAGCEVVTYDHWRSRGGDFTNLRSVVWHHDASPPGDSPGVVAYMLREAEAGRAWAQLWVSRRGVWHVLGAGVAFHAGRVLSGMPTNRSSLGVETDHTTGEVWPDPLLDSLRAGTAAILAHLGRSEAGLHFHSTICDPPGRKVDPDGLSLIAERARVGRLLVPTGSLNMPDPPAVNREIPPMLIVKNPAGNDQWLTLMGKRWRIDTVPELHAYEAACARVTLDAAAFGRLVEQA